VNYAPEARESVLIPTSRVAFHGGLVGEMLKQIEEHMTASSPAIVLEPAPSSRVDAIHILSVAAGYVGLACGFGAVALVVSWLL
jgi:hypothetical protein